MKKNAVALLFRPDLLPPAHQAAIADGDAAEARCALKCPELRTLRHALSGLTVTCNPKTIRHPFSAMLSLIVYGLICGADDIKAIWQKCASLYQRQRRTIGMTRHNKATGLLIMPGYGAINDMVNRIDPVELARALNAWLTENTDLLPKCLALDGKSIGAKGRLGGIERRRLARVDLDWKISLFPGARQLIRSTREWYENKSDKLKSETPATLSPVWRRKQEDPSVLPKPSVTTGL